MISCGLTRSNRSELVPRIVNGRASITACGVHTRRIAKVSTKIRQHRFARCIAQRRRCVVIEVNHVTLLPLPLNPALTLILILPGVHGAPGGRALPIVAASAVRRVAVAFQTRQRRASHSFAQLQRGRQRSGYRIGRFHSRNSSRVLAGRFFRFGTMRSCFSS